MRKEYRLSLLSSLILHGILLGLLLIQQQPVSKPYVVKKNPVPQKILAAVRVDQSQVDAEINQIKQQKKAQRQAETARKKALERQLALAKKKRLQEERRLAEIKRKARVLEKQRKREQAREEKRLAMLRQQKLRAAKHLAELKQQQEKIKNEARQRVARLQAKQVTERQRKAEAQKRMAVEQARKEKLAQQAKINGIVNKYKALIVNAIGQNWILPDNVDKRADCKFEIKIAPGGVVMDVKLVHSSGNSILDRSAQTAIYKASPLPVPSDPEAFNIFRVVRLTVRPENIVDKS